MQTVEPQENVAVNYKGVGIEMNIRNIGGPDNPAYKADLMILELAGDGFPNSGRSFPHIEAPFRTYEEAYNTTLLVAQRIIDGDQPVKLVTN